MKSVVWNDFHSHGIDSNGMDCASIHLCGIINQFMEWNSPVWNGFTLNRMEST